MKPAVGRMRRGGLAGLVKQTGRGSIGPKFGEETIPFFGWGGRDQGLNKEIGFDPVKAEQSTAFLGLLEAKTSAAFVLVQDKSALLQHFEIPVHGSLADLLLQSQFFHPKTGGGIP